MDVRVDDAGQIHMAWDNGRTLAVIPGVDTFRKLTPQEIAEEQQRGRQKPVCPLIGQNGNYAEPAIIPTLGL